MRITLLLVGKTTFGYVKDAVELYRSRISRYVQFALVEIPELKGVSSLSQESIKEKEGDLILSRLKPGDDVILLDERGMELRSVEFASYLQRKFVSASGRDIVFVVGGAYGFSDKVYARADGKLSLSRMTFSHQLVRAVFTEQLYRALTIIKGEPYHHE